MVSYTYNPQNQLTAYTDAQGITTNYTYAPDGLRSSKTQNGATTKFYWDRGFISAESQNGSITAENYIGINGVFARKANNTTAYMLKNGHGDVVSLLQNGAVVKTYDYDAYGKEKNIDQTDTNPFRYCGEYFDTEIGSIYLRNRYYAPDIGRFITEDPVKDGLNWYGYCGGNPVNYVDPNGLDAIIITNANGARFSESGSNSGIPMGHMAIVIQNELGEWFYFSCGKEYVIFQPVEDKFLSDINSFSEEYYWKGMYYTDATYIKGDFSDSYEYYKTYYEKNKTDNNVAAYSLLFNNCSTVVVNGLIKGELEDGTNVGTFIATDIKYDNILIGSPNAIMKSIKNIFYNEEFTKEDSHRVINDLLWEKKNGVWWNRDYYEATRLEKLH